MDYIRISIKWSQIKRIYFLLLNKKDDPENKIEKANFICAFCKEKYESKLNLSKHIMEEHISKGNYSTEVNKYNNGKENDEEKKETKNSSKDEHKNDFGDKLGLKHNTDENRKIVKEVDVEKGIYLK